MKMYFAQTAEEKADGVSIFNREQFVDSAMIFTSIGAGSHFHMQTVDYPIGIMSLDDEMKILDKAVLEAHRGTYTTVPRTANVVEVSMDLYNKWEVGETFA